MPDDPSKPTAKLDALSFEQALARLESVVERLEHGELELERSLSAFEEGVALVKLCSGRLDTARLRVSEFEEQPEGPVERGSDLQEEK